jgi:cardiolipin-specific phospholipase
MTLVEKEALGSYLHHCLAGAGSGEFALPLILAPGAWARQPLLPDVFMQLRMPVTFVYGARDWMDWLAGAEAVRILRSRGVPTSVHRVADAGHFPMLESAGIFNRLLIAAASGGELPKSS